MAVKNNWDDKIKDVEDFFNKMKRFPKQVVLSPGETIVDVKMFINSHLQIVKAQNGHNRFSSYMRRLMKLKDILEGDKVKKQLDKIKKKIS